MVGKNQNTKRKKPKNKACQVYAAKLTKEYKKRKIPRPQRHIRRLFKSLYPTQHNDYIMLRLHKQHDAPVSTREILAST